MRPRSSCVPTSRAIDLCILASVPLTLLTPLLLLMKLLLLRMQVILLKVSQDTINDKTVGFLHVEEAAVMQVAL